jgi:hypothetical protein
MRDEKKNAAVWCKTSPISVIFSLEQSNPATRGHFLQFECIPKLPFLHKHEGESGRVLKLLAGHTLQSLVEFKNRVEFLHCV